MTERTRILKLTARNVKRIQEVVIDEIGDIHEIRGDADQGKTSCLDALQGALEGLDKSMVRNGASSAELEVVLSDATIKRIINAADGKDTLMVTDNAGKAVDKAKDFLRTICGSATFRPLSWVQLGGGEKKGKTERLRMQRDQLLEALDVTLNGKKVVALIRRELGDDYVDAMDQVNLDGVDFTQHPFVVCRAFEAAVVDFRKLKNAEAERAEELLRNTPAPDIAAPREDLAACRAIEGQAVEAYHEAKAMAKGLESLQERQKALAARVSEGESSLPDAGKVAAARAKYEPKVSELQAQITDLEAQLAQAREGLTKARDAIAKCEDAERQIQRHADNVADLEAVNAQLATADGGADLEGLKAEMETAQARTKARMLQDHHDEAARVAAAARETAEQFTALVKLFRDEIPKQLLSEAKLPVEGLGIDDDQILINGVPLHQLGTSKQIRLGVLIAHALNPRSAFVLVDGAESMGKADRKALADTATELGLQLIMTFVDPEAVPSKGVTVMRGGEAVA